MSVTRAGVVRLDFADLVGQEGDVLHVVDTGLALGRFQERLTGTEVDATGGRA